MNKTERVAEATESVLLRAVEARTAKVMTAATIFGRKKQWFQARNHHIRASGVDGGRRSE